MVANLLAVLTFVLVISLQYHQFLASFRGINRKIRSSQKIVTKNVELIEGTNSALNCSTSIFGKKVDVYWKKDGETIPFPLTIFPIAVARCNHRGNYTCFTYDTNSTVVILKEFVVKVISGKASRNSAVCRPSGEDVLLRQKSDMCITPTIKDDFPCCNHPIPPPTMLKLRRKFSKKFTKNCNFYRTQNSKAKPWEIEVTWKLTPNASWTWGWQVSLTGLDNDLNAHRCVQINSRDKLLNWTFDDLLFGGKYEIIVQALPSDGKNYERKTIVLPRKKDKCKEIGRRCHWEICIPVVDVEQESTSFVLTWRPLNITARDFEIFYKGDGDCSHNGSRKVENATRIVLNINKCGRYHVKVRPIYSNGEEGTFGKAIVFRPPTRPTGQPTKASYTDVIASCTVAIALLIVVLIVIIVIKRKGKQQRLSLLPEQVVPEDEVIPNTANIRKTKVFIVHNNHCRLCNDVTHMLAHILGETGYVDCILDLLCKNEIAEIGMRWYEDKIKCCDKVLVVCTKEGKKIYDANNGQRKEGSYIFVLNMLLGQMGLMTNDERLQIVPVHFDISSPEDIPLFLNTRACYSLPSQIQDLCSALLSEYRLYNDSNVENFCDQNTLAIGQLKTAVKQMGQNHKGYNSRVLSRRETTSV